MKRYVKASRGDGFVGIWWYSNADNIRGVMKSVDDGVLDGMYIQYSDTENHLTLWHKVIEQNVENISERNAIINKGYKSLERGRVIYNTATMCYEVICSQALVNNLEFRRKIIEAYNLSGNRVEFEALHHYHTAELTGNPAVDEFEYGF